AEDRHHGADIDHLAIAGRFQRGIGELRAEEGAGEIGVDHLVPFLELELVRRLADAHAGVVDEDVDPAKIPEDTLDHRGDRRLVGDVGDDGNRFYATLREVGNCSSGLGDVASDHRDV